MKFLADMNISMDTVNGLRNQGYDVVHLSDQGLFKMEDIDILEKAKVEQRNILTCDLDFSQLLWRSNQSMPSVILFRFEYQTAENHLQALSKILSSSQDVIRQGAIVIADERKIRVRSLPMF